MSPELPYKSEPSPAVPQPLSDMNRAELPSAETEPRWARPHICCAASPRAPHLARAEPRRERQSRPAGSQPCAAERGAGSPGSSTDPRPSEPAPDGGWQSGDESSGYESESGERALEGGGGVRQRRARTAFTSEQVCRLEKTFQRQKYLGASERRKLAAALQLSEIQIKTWFQNRRMKLKRQIRDQQHSLVSPAPLYSYSYPPGAPLPLFQDGLHFPFAPQHHRLLPFAPVPAVQFSLPFPRYDASQNTYRFMTNELPYYLQHFLPHPPFHPVIQKKMDKQCHPVYAL